MSGTGPLKPPQDAMRDVLSQVDDQLIKQIGARALGTDEASARAQVAQAWAVCGVAHAVRQLADEVRRLREAMAP